MLSAGRALTATSRTLMLRRWDSSTSLANDSASRPARWRQENVVAEALHAGQRNPPVPEAITGSWVRMRSDARCTGAASGGAGCRCPAVHLGRLSHRGPRPRQFDVRCGGRNCSTIRWLVYSRVVFQVLVLQTRVSIQSGRSCFSICRIDHRAGVTLRIVLRYRMIPPAAQQPLPLGPGPQPRLPDISTRIAAVRLAAS